MSANFPKLFELGYIGKIEVKNRLIKAPTYTGFGWRDGCVTERLVRHYKELAMGNVGLIIVEYSYVDDKASRSHVCQLGVSNDEYLPGLSWLASTIQENGARAALQISHAGRQVFLTTLPVKAPSRVPWEAMYARGAPPPEELTFEEIVEIVEAFGDAALRAKKAGFDMVEVHGAHGYLITGFLSPITNKRTDWYGGTLENRMRFLLDVVRNIRNKVGADYPLSIRLSGSEYQEGGIEIEETIEVAKRLEKSGVNVIHISGGNHHTTDKQIVPMYWPLAYNVWAAEVVKKAVNIPVIASGSITTPELAEKILEEGKADFISLGRPLLADPYFPQKAQEGRPEDIRPCIRGCNGCVFTPTGAIACEVNVALGGEEELRIIAADKPKRVIVIGGGPAGMEAARVAAMRGHEVTLFEKRRLGGHLIEASTPEFKADIRLLIKYLSTQMEKLGIKVVGKEATAQTIVESRTDAVIIAAGATPIIPELPGIDKSLVLGVLDVLSGVEVGEEVVVVGGGMVGSEAALFLAEQGKKVTIVEMLPQIAPVPEARRGPRNAFFERLAKCKPPVTMYAETRLEEITDNGVIVSDKYAKRIKLEADTVVLALGFKTDRKLYDELSSLPDLQVYIVGDYVEPREIYDAIREGHIAARNL